MKQKLSRILSFIPAPKEWSVSFIAALIVHFFVFFGTGFAFIQSAQYGVEASSGGIEVSLIAALPAATKNDLAGIASLNNADEEGEREIVEEVKQNPEPKNNSTSNLQEKQNFEIAHHDLSFVGDGSSAVPGQDQTTLYSPGGGSVDEKEGYLKNPSPSYPREAVQRGQEGAVLLTAYVDQAGRPKKVEIKKSSGYRLLDESALKTIRRWKFDPAHVGMVYIDSTIDIPIRFVLEEELKRRS